jgi:hypothetical protein
MLLKDGIDYYEYVKKVLNTSCDEYSARDMIGVHYNGFLFWLLHIDH